MTPLPFILGVLCTLIIVAIIAAVNRFVKDVETNIDKLDRKIDLLKENTAYKTTTNELKRQLFLHENTIEQLSQTCKKVSENDT